MPNPLQNNQRIKCKQCKQTEIHHLNHLINLQYGVGMVEPMKRKIKRIHSIHDFELKTIN